MGETSRRNRQHISAFVFPPTPNPSNHTQHTHTTRTHLWSFVSSVSHLDSMHFLGFCLTPMGLSWFSNMEFLTECSVMEMERIPASQPPGNGGRKGDKQPNNIQIATLCSPGRVQTYCPFRLPTSHLKTNKTKTMNKQNCHHQQRHTDDSRRQPPIFLCRIVRGREWRGGKPSRCYDMEEEFMIMTL